MSVVSASAVGGGGGGAQASPVRSAMCAAARGGITAPLDVQNAAADVWSCTVRTRRESASSASPSCGSHLVLSERSSQGERRRDWAGCTRTLLAMIASSGASNGACGPRRAPAADASYALEVCRNSAVRSRACLAGEAGVVASK